MIDLNLLVAEKAGYERLYDELKYDSKISQCYKNALWDKILILEVKIWGLKKNYDFNR